MCKQREDTRGQRSRNAQTTAMTIGCSEMRTEGTSWLEHLLAMFPTHTRNENGRLKQRKTEAKRASGAASVRTRQVSIGRHQPAVLADSPRTRAPISRKS